MHDAPLCRTVRTGNSELGTREAGAFHGHTKLPCYPCPHSSACCAYGVTLSEEEAEALGGRHGQDKVYRTRWGEWRTRVRRGRCVFLVDNSCSIHDDPHYPAVCHGFPWTDAETGGPYEFDQTICPEFVRRPELVQIGRSRGAGGPRSSGAGERGAAEQGTPSGMPADHLAWRSDGDLE